VFRLLELFSGLFDSKVSVKSDAEQASARIEGLEPPSEPLRMDRHL
jgi:hypothetical protein